MADSSSGSSTSAFVTTLIFNLIIFAVFITVFVVLRNKYLSVYRPRTINETIPNHLVPVAPPTSAFGWIKYLLFQPEKFAIQYAGIDGYFFLRYLRTFAFLGILGGLILWPILFAINATGGGGKTGFDIISYSNNTYKWRTFAHLFCSWYFFGLIIYTIYTELVFYTSFRHNMQCTPFYRSLPSSKVLLIDNVDEGLLFEDSLKQLFPSVKRIRITRDTKKLQEVCEKREKLVNKLEGGFVNVLKKCVKLKFKAEKKEKPCPEPSDKITSYIPEKKLPTYKLKPIIGEKKKIFNEGFDQLESFNEDVDKYQSTYPDAFENKVGSVFLEFPSHFEMQRAYQSIGYSDHFKKSRCFQSFMPNEVIWKNVGLGYAARKSKKSGANTFLCLMIIFWAIPVAVVGCISNINYLTEKVPFLRFINNMPTVLLGIITGLLPTVLLSILMSLVPPIIRWWGKFGGCMTVQQLDFWTQQWFFAFEVIQVFLITTCTSAASSVVTSIINNPSEAMTMLSEQLPPASNFYICYMLLQGLAISSGSLAQIVGLILSFVLGRFLDKTPRQLWQRRVGLSAPSWGTMYGLYGMFTVIMLCFAIISPIIIAFTVIAYYLIYWAQMYSMVYVSGHGIDNRGRNYPLALFQVFVGLYLAEVCLIGLFVMQKNWAIVVLEAISIAVTVACHLYFRWLFEPIMDTVPVGAIKGDYPNDLGLSDVKKEGEAYFVGNTAVGDNNINNTDIPVGGSTNDDPTPKLNKDTESSLNGGNHSEEKKDEYLSSHLSTVDADADISNYTFAQENNETMEHMGYKGMIEKFLHPKRFMTFKFYRNYMPDFWMAPIEPRLIEDFKYETPYVTEDKPSLWIPADKMGLSTEIKGLCSDRDIPITDQYATVEGKAKVEITDDAVPPNWKPDLVY